MLALVSVEPDPEEEYNDESMVDPLASVTVDDDDGVLI